MLFTEEKERSHRFKLALRMGLPIFALSTVVSFAKVIEYTNSIPASFYIISVGILAVAVYFIFYLIYKGMDEKITDSVTHTFTRDYLFQDFTNSIAKGDQTFILISIDNLDAINSDYGNKNGDKVLYETAQWIGSFLKTKGIEKFPIGHFKGGDFLLSLEGKKGKYLSILEIMCIKFDDHVIDEIEVHISGSIIDTSYSKELPQIIDRLYELQAQKRDSKIELLEEQTESPSQTEINVIDAIKRKAVAVMYQEVKTGENIYLLDSSFKLIRDDEKLIHQKSYVPIINRLGLRREFDYMALEKIIEDAARVEYKLAITLSPATVRNREFYQDVEKHFLHNKELSSKVIFVLAEKEKYLHVSRYKNTLESYRRLGIEIAFDFMGELHSTFEYIKEIDVDYLRFDSSYSKEIEQDKYSAIIASFVHLCKVLGVRSWMKMIENAETLERAKALEIDLVQGYEIGKIKDLKEIV